MPIIEDRLKALGLTLPPPLKVPPGVVLPFAFVRVVGTRALISGHGPQAAGGVEGIGCSGQIGRIEAQDEIGLTPKGIVGPDQHLPGRLGLRFGERQALQGF